METNKNYLMLLFFVFSLCLSSCGKIEEIGVENETIEVGFLNIKAQLIEEKNVNATGKPPTLGEVLSRLVVKIYGDDPDTGFKTVVVSSNYNDLPASIQLGTGSYDIVIRPIEISFEQYSSRLDFGDYGFQSSFTITAGNNTEVNAPLALLDTALTFDFTDEVLTNYPNIEASASINYNDGNVSIAPLTWLAADDNRTGYFNMSEVIYNPPFEAEQWLAISGDLVVSISSVSNTGSDVLVNRIYTGVSPNEHYILTISYSGGASATLNVTLGDETIIEDDIPFPG